MNKKYQLLFLLSIFAIELFGSTVSISVEATTPTPQPGDMSIVASVVTNNISLYSTAGINLTAKIMSIPSVKLVTGTNQNALYTYFVTQMFDDYLNTLQSSTVTGPFISAKTSTSSSRAPLTIYSLSSSGIKHLGIHPNIQQFLPRLSSFYPSHDSLFSYNSRDYTYDINSFAKMLGVNQSDFNAIGHEAINQEKFKTGDILSAGTRSYDPLDNVNTSTAFNDVYGQVAINMGILDVSGTPTNTSLSTENLVGGTSDNTKYDVLTAGYTNFDKEAIQDPFINYYVNLQASNGTVVDPTTFYANYTAVNSSTISQFESDNLKSVIMGPIDSSLSSSTNTIGAHVAFDKKVTVSVFGLSVYSQNSKSSLQSLQMSFTHVSAKPLLSLNSFTALSKATTTSFMSNVGSSIGMINKIKDMTSGGLYGAMTGNTGINLGYARQGSLTSSSVTRETADSTNPNQATHSSVVQSTSIKHQILTFLKSYAPFILIGVGAVAVIAFVVIGKKKLI